MFVCNVPVWGSVLIAAGLAAGCATVNEGTDFDMVKAQSFVKGRTTRADIVTTLGSPASSGTTGGTRFIEYRYQRTSANVLTSFGVGSVQDHLKQCRFTLDTTDVLRDVSCAEGTPSYSNLGN